MAKKTSRKDTASAMKLTQELRHPWLMPVLAVFYFFVTCLMLQGKYSVLSTHRVWTER